MSFFEMLGYVLWPIATVGIAAIACFGFCQWLRRDEKTVRELKYELGATQAEWTKRFDNLERQCDARMTTLEKRVNALQPAMNPLGSHYSTRGPA